MQLGKEGLGGHVGTIRPLRLCLPEAWAEICLVSRGSILPSGLSPMSPHSCPLSPAARMLVTPLVLMLSIATCGTFPCGLI